MKIGDLVTVSPHGKNHYLIIGEDPERENNQSSYDATKLGKLYFLYDSISGEIKEMHERWVVVVNE